MGRAESPWVPWGQAVRDPSLGAHQSLGSTCLSIATNTGWAARIQRVSPLQAPAPGIGRMNRDLVW